MLLKDVKNIRIGTQPVKAVWYQGRKLWPTTAPEPAPGGETRILTIDGKAGVGVSSIYVRESTDHSVRGWKFTHEGTTYTITGLETRYGSFRLYVSPRLQSYMSDGTKITLRKPPPQGGLGLFYTPKQGRKHNV